MKLKTTNACATNDSVVKPQATQAMVAAQPVAAAAGARATALREEVVFIKAILPRLEAQQEGKMHVQQRSPHIYPGTLPTPHLSCGLYFGVYIGP